MRIEKIMILLSLLVLYSSVRSLNTESTTTTSQQSELGRDASPEDLLKEKAKAYDQWSVQHNMPYYGGLLTVLYADDKYTQPIEYDNIGDSCMWTGTYLGSQAMRYHSTHDPTAKTNAIRSVNTLHGYLHVTYTSGYIARYWAPQESIPYKNDAYCATRPRCHKVITGKYAGDYWEGETTKDQYIGWFHGMSLAYDFIDDEEIKKMIREDIAEAVDKLRRSDWLILDENGKYPFFSAGQRPTYVCKLTWLTMAYHMTQNQIYKQELDNLLDWYHFMSEELSSYAATVNQYDQYYANNLGHMLWYNLLRLGKKYFAPEHYQRLKEIFSERVHSFVKLAHNPWFNGIFMSQGNYHPQLTGEDPHKAQLVQDLLDFRPPPNHVYMVPERDPATYTLDQGSSWLKYFPRLLQLMASIKLGIRPQAREGFPIKEQCSGEFLFEKNPHVIDRCGVDFALYVHAGHDYLAAYWLAVHEGLIKHPQ